MEDRFSREIKKGALEMLVLKLVCEKPTYGYDLLSRLKESSDRWLTLKEGTLYPILYRLEDEGFIAAQWQTGEGRTAPKKMYAATEKGQTECHRRMAVWGEFTAIVDQILAGGNAQ